MRPNRLEQIKRKQATHTPANTGVSLQSLADYQNALIIDLGKIANQKDIADKIRVKKTVLPTYIRFIDDYIKQGHNYPNDVAVQVMVWLLDVGEIDYGFNLAMIMAKQKQIMPAKFDRDIYTFLCDFFYDWASEQLKQQQSANPYLEVLIVTLDSDQWDVHPLCKSKLYAMQAKHCEQRGEHAQAIALCDKAMQINPEKHGVKGLKERLLKATQG